MCKVNIYEAKTNLSKYVEMLEKGLENEIIISRYGKEVAKITLLNEKEKGMRVGAGEFLYGKKDFTLKEDDDNLGELFGY